MALWAASALPMGVLSWLVAPLIAGSFSGSGTIPMAKALIMVITAGLIWQVVLVAIMLSREQPDLRWATVREALWLRAPQSPKSGRRGGRMWLVLIPLIVVFGAVHELIGLPAPVNRDLGMFLGSDAGQAFFEGAWAWFVIVVVMQFLNSVGEEVMWRGLMLPRMNGAFGRADWVANGVLFGFYHLHVPWAIPGALFDMFTQGYPSKRYRSAWIGIAVHGAQGVFFIFLLLGLVLGRAG